MREKKTMKAAVLRAFHQPLSVEEVPRPKPGPGEALVRVMASGLCLTDAHIQEGLIKSVKLPYIPGHEMAGVIEELGPGVTDPALAVGTHVVCGIDIVCGTCLLCRLGREHLCTNRVRVGFERDGSYAQYAAVPARNLVPISGEVPFEQAAVIPDAVACMYHAVKDQGRVKEGDRVLIFGVGGLGLQGVQIAGHLGASVYAVSRTQAKLDQAMALGAKAAINTREQDPVTAISGLTGGEMCDAAFDLVGTRDSVNLLLQCVRPGGKVIAMAYAADSFQINCQETVIKEKEVLGLRGSSRQNLEECVRLVEQKVLVPIVSDVFPLEKVNEALQFLKDGRSIGRSAIVFEHQEEK